MPSNEPFRPWLFVPEIVYPYDPRLKPLPPPDTGIFDCPQVQVCINSKWVSHLDGLIERLLFRDAWLADETEIDRATGEISKLLSVLKVDNMSCCCDDNLQKIYRYDENGNLEVSTDGGVTWEDAPQDDPRFTSTIAPPLPGPDGDDKKCAAAASAAEFISTQFVDQIQDAMTVGQIVALIAAIIAIILSAPAGAIIGPIIVTIVGNIVNVGASVIQSAFDSTQKTLLQCILYCRASDDGSFTKTAWEGVKSDIMEQMSEVVATFLRDAVNVMGPVGLTNASRMGLLSGVTDCTSCDCPDCSYLITFDGANWQEYTIEYGTLSSNQLHVVAHEFPLGSGHGINMLIDLQQLCQVNFISCDFLGVNQRPGNSIDITATFYDAEMNSLGSQGFSSGFVADGVEHHGSSPVAGITCRYIGVFYGWIDVGAPNSGWIDNIAINEP